MAYTIVSKSSITRTFTCVLPVYQSSYVLGTMSFQISQFSQFMALQSVLSFYLFTQQTSSLAQVVVFIPSLRKAFYEFLNRLEMFSPSQPFVL